MYCGVLANRKYKGADDTTSFYFVRPATFPDAEPSGENAEAELPFIEPAYEVKLDSVGPRVKGDVDKACYEKALAYTPNPGGVGPMTRAMLLENVVEMAERQL